MTVLPYKIKKTFWKRFAICLAGVNFLFPSIAMASCPSPLFSGFNTSAGVGLEMPYISMNGELRNTIPGVLDLTFNINRQPTINRINGGLRLGYNKVLRGLYLIGLAADASFCDAHLQFGTLVTEPGTDLIIATNSSIKLSSQFAMLLKFGKLVNPCTLLYGLIGPRWGRFTLDFDARYQQNVGVLLNSTLEAQDRCYKSGVLLGIGSEFMLTKCISLALEYTHTYYGHPKLPTTSAVVTQDGIVIPGSEFSQSSKLTARTNSVALRLGYYF